MNEDFPTPDELAAATTRAGGIYARFHAELDARPVTPKTTRAAMREAFAGTLGDEGVGLEGVLDDFEERVLPHAMATPHPCYTGLVNSSPLAAAPIADLLVSLMNNNNGAFHQSPPATAAEEEVVRAFSQQLGYVEDASGVILAGGTFANLHGLMLARTAHFPEWRQRGPAAAHEPRLYTSQATHFCIARTASILGIGEANAIALPTIGRGHIDPQSLRRRILADREAGYSPFAVVATIGTTGTGAIDDVEAIADITEELGLWLHVDACYGGAAGLLPEFAADFRGLPRADSVATDPHKWFFMPIVAGLALTKHPEVERAAFDLETPYIPTDGTLDAFCRAAPTSRRASGLAVWAALRAHGFDTIRAAVRRNIDQMRMLENRLADAGFEVLPEGRMSIACARYAPSGLDAAATDALQGQIATHVQASGAAWFSTTRFADRTWLRFNTVNLHTRDVHVERITTAVIAAARELAAAS